MVLVEGIDTVLVTMFDPMITGYDAGGIGDNFFILSVCTDSFGDLNLEFMLIPDGFTISPVDKDFNNLTGDHPGERIQVCQSASWVGFHLWGSCIHLVHPLYG